MGVVIDTSMLIAAAIRERRFGGILTCCFWYIGRLEKSYGENFPRFPILGNNKIRTLQTRDHRIRQGESL